LPRPTISRKRRDLISTGFGGTKGFSPLRYGDSIVGQRLFASTNQIESVSVPFAMGTALLERKTPRFQVIGFGFSPLRYGDSIVGNNSTTKRLHVGCVSVPFAMGTALLGPTGPTGPTGSTGFSPLRYGDSIVGVREPGPELRSGRFSPLRYGDSIVGFFGSFCATGFCVFQSPSLWGQHCWLNPFIAAAALVFRFSPLRYGDSIVGDLSQSV
jgi:hypothetical protein